MRERLGELDGDGREDIKTPSRREKDEQNAGVDRAVAEARSPKAEGRS